MIIGVSVNPKAPAEAIKNALQSAPQTAAPVIYKFPGASSKPRLSHSREGKKPR